MLGIVRTISFAREFFHNFVNTLVVPRIVPAARVVRVGSAHQELLLGHLGEHPHVVVAVVLAFPLHETELSISVSGVPSYPQICIFCQVAQADVVNHVSSPDK